MEEKQPVPGISPLDGILVADFSRVLAGPLCTMTLADLGARVIKVERPGTGDDTRAWGPPFSATGSTYFESVNRNKESVALDLRDPADLAHARELALRADVLVENFMPWVMEKLGLGYEQLQAQNPGLIYASISGFGSAAGASLPGYDFIVQALGGLMSITGDAAGAPTKAGVALVDVLTAKDATIGILAALNSAPRPATERVWRSTSCPRCRVRWPTRARPIWGPAWWPGAWATSIPRSSPTSCWTVPMASWQWLAATTASSPGSRPN